MPHRDQDGGDLDPREYPDPDSDDNGYDDTVACPHCQRPIYEEAEQCAHCGQYVSEEDSASTRPRWVIVGAILCLAMALMWAFWGF